MKAYWVNSTEKTVSAVDYKEGELQKYVGGSIETAFVWTNGDVLYVDEKGLLKNPRYFFHVPERPDQALAGNGMLVGREIDDTARTAPPTISLPAFTARVRFLSNI